jgi:hypothetical protein
VDAYNHMKSGTLMRQIVNKLNEIDFNRAADRHEFGDIYEKILADPQAERASSFSSTGPSSASSSGVSSRDETCARRTSQPRSIYSARR